MKITCVTVERDTAYLGLASDLRFEAARAAAGFVVDEVKGTLTGKAYGSHHEERLKGDAAYREAFATALLETADAAQVRGSLGKPEPEAEPQAKGIETSIRDPHTGETIAIRRALENTPLNRARYSSADPITDLQWLAGTTFEADFSGEIAYNGNCAIIAANGAFRIQGEGVQQNARVGGMLGDEGAALFADDPSEEMNSNAWRLARVTRGMTALEQRQARAWIIDHTAPVRAGDFVALLDKLVNLYATHDEHFAFDKWRHNFTTLGQREVEAANDNDAPKGKRRTRKA